MLKGISPLISPDLLAILDSMGHGDEIVLADAHFPGSICPVELRATGIRIPPLLHAILPLFVLDHYAGDPVVMMDAAGGDAFDAHILAAYRTAISAHDAKAPEIRFLAREPFYERAKKAYAVVITGETARYGNIILKKGITPVHQT